MRQPNALSVACVLCVLALGVILIFSAFLMFCFDEDIRMDGGIWLDEVLLSSSVNRSGPNGNYNGLVAVTVARHISIHTSFAGVL